MGKADMIMLDSTNYRTWKGKMEDLLYVKDLAEPIENKGVAPASYKDKDAEWKKLDRKSLGSIRRWISGSVISHVEEETTAYGAWSKLESLCASKTAGNKVQLMRKLYNLKYADGKPIAEHLNEFQSVFIQLKNMSITFDDEVQALMVMGSLPQTWETLAVSLSNSAPGGKLTLASVTSSLLGEEIRRGGSNQASTSNSEALVTGNRGRSRSRKQNNYRGKSKGKSKDYMNGKPCHNCGKLGHWKKECTEPKKKNNGKQKPKAQHEESETDIVTSDDDVAIVSEWVGACTSTTCEEGEWVIDSGASFHVTPRKDFFSSYAAGDYGHVRMGNKDTAKVVGKGSIRLEMSTGCSLLLKEVRHVPDLRLSLISCGKLDDGGYYNTFGNGIWKLSI